MRNLAILQPAIVLVLWTLVMLFWMAIARASGSRQVAKDALRTLPRVGGRGQDIDRVVPANCAWPSHNYAHLHEQPTLFYATIVILALLGASTGTNLALAWAYVGLRIAHSIWQSTVNTLPIRFGLFILSTICLIGLAANALVATL
jgi:hypothetical protein